jgi:hypothetical protein
MVVMDPEPDRLASLAPPAPLGLRGVWVVRRVVAPTPWRGVLTCPRASVRGRASRAPPPKPGPRLPLARALGAAAPADRGHDRHHHGIHRLAVALGAGVLCRRGARKKLGLKLASEKTDGGRVYRIAGGKAGAIEPDTTAAQPSRLIMRRRWREPAAIAAEIDRNGRKASGARQ